MRKLLKIVLLVLVALVTGNVLANTTESSTMWFGSEETTQIYAADGPTLLWSAGVSAFVGTAGAHAGYFYPAGGFDIYADAVDNDALSGQTPDVSNWGDYTLTLDVAEWSLSDGVSTVMSGDLTWNSGIAEYVGGSGYATVTGGQWVASWGTVDLGFPGFAVNVEIHHSVPWYEVSMTPAPVPAPGAIMLGSIGVGIVGWLRRRRTL